MIREQADVADGEIAAVLVNDDEEITLYLINPKAPCFIKDKEESYIYLILPVNINTVTA